jgi:[calcium/calmodulin-dependent protein kinase] kinase
LLSGARGTYEFLAPECCDPGSRSFSGKAADVWALGVTIYCLAFNEVPFQAAQGMSVLKAIQTLPLEFEGKRSVSDSLKRFLLKVLEKDPAKRYTLEQMKKDEWVNEGL